MVSPRASTTDPLGGALALGPRLLVGAPLTLAPQQRPLIGTPSSFGPSAMFIGHRLLGGALLAPVPQQQLLGNAPWFLVPQVSVPWR